MHALISRETISGIVDDSFEFLQPGAGSRDWISVADIKQGIQSIHERNRLGETCEQSSCMVEVERGL